MRSGASAQRYSQHSQKLVEQMRLLKTQAVALHLAEEMDVMQRSANKTSSAASVRQTSSAGGVRQTSSAVGVQHTSLAAGVPQYRQRMAVPWNWREEAPAELVRLDIQLSPVEMLSNRAQRLRKVAKDVCFLCKNFVGQFGNPRGLGT